MKKLFSALLIIICMCVTSVSAEIIGEVLCTDIGALIDDSPVESYNIKDYTYLVAEDLENYGFDVVWDGKTRTLQISHNVRKGYEIALSKEKINIKKSDIPMRKHYAYVYSTDIRTFLDGKEIDACNIDGRTLIQVDNLTQYGEFYYNDERRMVELRIMKPSFEYGIKIAENKVETMVDFYPGKYRQQMECMGLVDENGNPFGIGKVSAPGEGYDITFAYWNGYEKQDTYYAEKKEINNKSARHYGCYKGRLGDTVISIFGEGENPYTMTCTERYEYDGRVSRNGIYDSSYLYGFYISDETFYDEEGMTVNYGDGQEKKFSEVMADKRFAQIAYVKTADGKVYAAGIGGATEDTGWESSENFYKVFVRTNNDDFPEPPFKPMVSGYATFSAADAGAYNRIISLNGKGEVFYERYPGIWSELRVDQSDKLNMSEPVKVFENAKYVNIQLEDSGIVTDTAYIPYFYVIDRENNLWHWNYEYYNQKEIGNGYDENNGYIAYGRVEYIKKPELIAGNVKKVFGTEEKILFKTDGTVVRITKSGEEPLLDNVADMDADMFGLNFIAVKTDGSLWTWGKNQNGQCGVGHTDYVWKPTEISRVYEKNY